ncbi:class I SAM-dependent methyltransferase [Candidatus Nitrosocosmicus agrestis]|uniref:class I SAM-dependent methyltransferase n=1 Tax=Candidatus Nitrosocosmicus agrestis TaxID=2563600 RepID=UPI0021065A13|nr:methyltransferase domain-containing protein [Candidatus Nitrosocosmicus sp. SS]
MSHYMLAVAKERSISLGLQDVMDFMEGDAETTDLLSSTFDAALCRFGLVFLPNVKAGLSNIHSRSSVNAGDSLQQFGLLRTGLLLFHYHLICY